MCVFSVASTVGDKTAEIYQNVFVVFRLNLILSFADSTYLRVASLHFIIKKKKRKQSYVFIREFFDSN